MSLSPKERVEQLSSRLGYEFSELSTALCALTHKSYTNEHRELSGSDNERLEFLGDAVVDLAISHRLMERFPTASEGTLSKLRALIVNEEGLARVARSMQLGELVLLGRGEALSGGKDKNSVLADALEAVLGAVYLSGGMAPVLMLVDKFFTEALEGVAEGKVGADYKTLLQEQSQNKLKLAPKYKVLAETGPDHSKIFEVEVTLSPEWSARAQGKSKKEAEQAAARAMLSTLNSEAKGT